VWQFVNDDSDELAVRPVNRLPVLTLTGKIVGTQVRLGNGGYVWALISNLDTKNARLNEHFVTLSIERNGRWFHLARYHDIGYSTHGPEALARFLGLSPDDVFPIAYDISNYAKGEAVALAGTILREPRVRLRREKIIAMAVPPPTSIRRD
jgi:hypothetical protein